MLPRLLAPLVIVLAAGLAACTSAGSAQLRVVGVRQAPADAMVLSVRVVNHTRKAMRLERLEYTFAGASQANVALDHRNIEPGAAIVVEVPVELEDAYAAGGVLKGRLFAELDQIIQSFPVTAQVAPGS